MKRILAVLLALITLLGVLSMTACGKNDGVPKGMQLVRGGSDVGYNFYGPEEWVVANYGSISCTYASKIDISSMTFTETVKPEGTVAEYFANERTKFPYEINVTVDGEDCNFGNALTPAKKYVYTYEYKEYSYTCMQIFVSHNDRFFIFTYTAGNAEKRGTGKSYYSFYLDKVQAAIEEFRFTDKVDTYPIANYERDAEGYKLISDKVIAGFKLYVPDSFNVDFSSALVSATHADGTNINVSRASIYAYPDYWEERVENVIAFADKVPEGENGALVTSFKQIGTEPTQLQLDDTMGALAYEYTYTFEGVSYHVYQVHIIQSRNDVYIFTYIATEENYQAHFEEMQKVLDKIEY